MLLSGEEKSDMISHGVAILFSDLNKWLFVLVDSFRNLWEKKWFRYDFW